MSEASVMRSALGRDCSLGDLYNVFSDEFCGVNIFKQPLPDSLVKIQDTSSTTFDYIFTDNLKEKFDKYQIEGELGISILCKFIPFFTGSGRYFTNNSYSQRCVRSSLIYKVQTKAQTLIMTPDLREYMNFQILENTSATHVVKKINWGANATVTLEANVDFKEDLKKTKFDINASLLNMQGALEGQRRKNKGQQDGDKHFSVRMDADVMHDGPIPQTVEEALGIISKIPILIRECNKGLGKPLTFVLFPLKEFNKIYEVINLRCLKLVPRLSDRYFLRCTRLFDSINHLEQKIFDQIKVMSNEQLCLSPNYIDLAIKLQEDVLEFESSLREHLAESVLKYRKGKNVKFFDIKYWDQLCDFEKRLKYLKPALDQIQQIEKLRSIGVIYLGRNDSLQNELLGVHSAFVIFISANFQKNESDFLNQMSYFMELVETEKDSKMIAVNLDLCMNGQEIESTKIVKYKKGRIVCKDCYREASSEGLNLVYSTEGFALVATKPSQRRPLEIFCPRALEREECSNIKVFWHCATCREEVEYGYDGFYYCRCGRGVCTKYKYRCASESHWTYVDFDETILTEYLKLMGITKCMNILLLGSSGVGKSTWVNSVINYLTYDSVEEAANFGPRIHIPVNFNITNYDMVTHNVKINVEGSTENLKTGESGTMEVKTYSFFWEDTIVQLIDTPGVGEVKNNQATNYEELFEREKKKIAEILEHMSFMDEIHGICILLKPNEARFDQLFRLCITEILTNLHNSAIENLIFCFTHACSTGKKVGETAPVLKSFLDDLKLKISLTRNTSYFFQNESFRYLCSLRVPAITYEKEEIDSFAESWKMSVKETKRLFTFIKELEPHKITDSLSVADVRKKIFDITMPMVDITKNIMDNINAIEVKRQEILYSEKSEEELVKDLIIPHIELMPIKQGKPRTVCCSPTCVTTHVVCGKTVTKYKKICCDGCWLPNFFGRSKHLSMCWSMKAFGGICKKCTCHYSNHIHTPYILEEIESSRLPVADEVEKEMSNRDKINAKIEEMSNLIEELKKERDQILEVSILFGNFLRQHAITAYNDGMREYLRLVIFNEMRSSNKTEVDIKVLKSLQDYCMRYDEERDIFNARIHSEKSREIVHVNEIYKKMKKLEGLKHAGPKFKELNSSTSKSSDRQLYKNVEYLFLSKTASTKNYQNLARGIFSYFCGFTDQLFPNIKDGQVLIEEGQVPIEEDQVLDISEID